MTDKMNQSITSQLSDEAIHQILEIIASEIDGIDDKELNIEFKDVKITEIHLRSGNDIALESNIGDEYYPIWKGDNVEHLKHLDEIN